MSLAGVEGGRAGGGREGGGGELDGAQRKAGEPGREQRCGVRACSAEMRRK